MELLTKKQTKNQESYLSKSNHRYKRSQTKLNISEPILQFSPCKIEHKTIRSPLAKHNHGGSSVIPSTKLKNMQIHKTILSQRSQENTMPIIQSIGTNIEITRNSPSKSISRSYSLPHSVLVARSLKSRRLSLHMKKTKYEFQSNEHNLPIVSNRISLYENSTLNKNSLNENTMILEIKEDDLESQKNDYDTQTIKNAYQPYQREKKRTQKAQSIRRKIIGSQTGKIQITNNISVSNKDLNLPDIPIQKFQFKSEKNKQNITAIINKRKYACSRMSSVIKQDLVKKQRNKLVETPDKQFKSFILSSTKFSSNNTNETISTVNTTNMQENIGVLKNIKTVDPIQEISDEIPKDTTKLYKKLHVLAKESVMLHPKISVPPVFAFDLKMSIKNPIFCGLDSLIEIHYN